MVIKIRDHKYALVIVTYVAMTISLHLIIISYMTVTICIHLVMIIYHDHKSIFSYGRLHDRDQISWKTLGVFLIYCHGFLAPVTKNGTIWS